MKYGLEFFGLESMEHFEAIVDKETESYINILKQRITLRKDSPLLTPTLTEAVITACRESYKAGFTDGAFNIIERTKEDE